VWLIDKKDKDRSHDESSGVMSHGQVTEHGTDHVTEHVTVIVALNGAGVIPAEEGQDVGRVLREDRLTATRCKLDNKEGWKAIRGWPRSRKGRDGTGRYLLGVEGIERWWKTRWAQGRLRILGDDSEGLGGTRYRLGRLGDSVVLGGNSGDSG